MKQFNRLPRWLRVLIPAVFVALCIAINAVAFTEIVQSFQSRQDAGAAVDVADAEIEGESATVQTDTPKSRLEITPVISPDATLDRAVAQSRRANQQSDTASERAIASPSNTDKHSTANTAASDSLATNPTSVAETTPFISDTAETSATPAPQPEAKYGHFPYPVANPAQMSLIASYAEGDGQRPETLHPEAATALLEMVAAARSAGIWLVPASGYRTIAQQRTLFNDQMAAKGSPEAAALVSAPPGYSEHHTGYAVDLTDGSLPQSDDISLSFADAPAYQWLLENASAYGYELSFPEDNAQGISYEPWHWRYVGSLAARRALGLVQKEDAGAPQAEAPSDAQSNAQSDAQSDDFTQVAAE